MASAQRRSFALLLLTLCSACISFEEQSQGPDDDTFGVDAGGTVSAGGRCQRVGTKLTCKRRDASVSYGSFVEITRGLHFQLPVDPAPTAGYPVAILFHGSFFGAETFWEANDGDAYGRLHQVELVSALLAAGIAVITPEAKLGTFWDTNVLPYSVAWESAPDHAVVTALLASIESGALGDLDQQRMFAAGISSGGYMTSRMAVSYPGRFRALAIQSASYATCSGALCEVPSVLPAEHPPTLFLHGDRDELVPIRTAEAYAQRLTAQAIPTRLDRDASAEHEWLASSPAAIVDWFSAR